MPPSRLLEQPGALGDRAGERAARVAEQLGLDQFVGQRRAVERAERRSCAARWPDESARATSSLPLPLSAFTSTG